jgi:hypothetical protein
VINLSSVKLAPCKKNENDARTLAGHSSPS